VSLATGLMLSSGSGCICAQRNATGFEFKHRALDALTYSPGPRPFRWERFEIGHTRQTKSNARDSSVSLTASLSDYPLLAFFAVIGATATPAARSHLASPAGASPLHRRHLAVAPLIGDGNNPYRNLGLLGTFTVLTPQQRPAT
jgi:hypothetical protein